MAFEHVRGHSYPSAPPLPPLVVDSRKQRGAERERSGGHGHGMSRNRTPKSDAGLPHGADRTERQPYAREVEDYSGEGVAHPPEEQTAPRAEPPAPARR